MRNRIYTISNSNKYKNGPDLKINKYHSSQKHPNLYLLENINGNSYNRMLDEFYC